MSKKLTAYMMSKLNEGAKRINDSGHDFEGCYLSVVSEKDALVKADDDFTLGTGVALALGEDFTLIDGLEFKFLSNVSYGKLYELKVSYEPALEDQIEHELNL